MREPDDGASRTDLVGEDRLPPLPDEQLTPEQAAAVAAVRAGPRGELAGNWVPLLRSPELMTRLQRLGEYLRFEKLLDDDLLELVILLVARHWDNDFEWWFHHPIALRVGLPEEVVDAVGRGRRAEQGRPEVHAVWTLVEELQRTRRVSDPVWQHAVQLLGEPKVVEVVGTCGYYTTLAMTMNAAQTPAPDGPRLPERA